MHKPVWGGNKQNLDNSKILLVYRLPAENESVKENRPNPIYARLPEL